MKKYNRDTYGSEVSKRSERSRKKGKAALGLTETHTEEEEEELKKIEKELHAASKMHKGQAERIKDIVKEELTAYLMRLAIAENKKKGSKGLWHNIRKRRKEGKPRLKPGQKGYPKTLDIDEQLEYYHITDAIYDDGTLAEDIEFWDDVLEEAEYQGRKVTLNKPMQGDVKKSKVYVKNEKGNVVKVNFGDPDMKIRKSNPEARKSFRARHKCDQKKPKTSAGYWSCKAW